AGHPQAPDGVGRRRKASETGARQSQAATNGAAARRLEVQMGVSRVLSCALGALVCALCAGCAHTQSGAEPSGEADAREVTVLRERVARLERRLSDLDAQMALLTRKVAETPRDSVS